MRRIALLNLSLEELAALLGLHPSFELKEAVYGLRENKVTMLVEQIYDEVPIDTEIPYLGYHSEPTHRCIEKILSMLRVSPYLPQSDAKSKLFYDWIDYRREMRQKMEIENAKKLLEKDYIIIERKDNEQDQNKL